MIKSRLYNTFQAKLQIIDGHLKEFNKGPGFVLLVITLQACHASVTIDVEAAQLILVSLSLSSYLRENMIDCANTVQGIIKLMQNEIALPGSTVSLVLRN